jgi:hypothetical protein
MTLIRAATGENFNGMMYDLMIAPPYCDPNPLSGNCGVSRSLSAFYWVCFYTISTFILMNLLVAVVIYSV